MTIQGPGSGSRLNPSVERTHAITGLAAVLAADLFIGLAAIFGMAYAARGGSENSAQIVAILSTALTAIGTTTTAYFGIKSMSNTASNLANTSPRPVGNTTSGSSDTSSS